MKEPEIRVSVDPDFARIAGKTYAINKINSVEIKKRHPNGQGLPFIVSLVALGLLISRSYALGIVVAAVAGWLWWRSRDIEYQLFLTTSSSEVAALKSRDMEFVDELRRKIEAAMALK